MDVYRDYFVERAHARHRRQLRVIRDLAFAVGAFRFHCEYALAARLIKEGRINVKPIITATLPMERAVEAFEMAADRKAHMKVQLTF